MPVNFPDSLDTIVRPGPTFAAPSHTSQHDDIATAIERLEAKVGADDSNVTTTLDYRVAQLEVEPAAHTHVCGETPSGTVDGSNVLFHLAHHPSPEASLMLYMNGLLLAVGDTKDFILSGSTVSFSEAPPSGSFLVAHYII